MWAATVLTVMQFQTHSYYALAVWLLHVWLSRQLNRYSLKCVEGTTNHFELVVCSYLSASMSVGSLYVYCTIPKDVSTLAIDIGCSLVAVGLVFSTFGTEDEDAKLK